MEIFYKIAKKMVSESLPLKAGDLLFLEILGRENKPLGEVIKEYAESQGINVFYRYSSLYEKHKFWSAMTNEKLQPLIEEDCDFMRRVCGYITVRAEPTYTLDEEHRGMQYEHMQKVHYEIRVLKPWILTMLPTREMAEKNKIRYRDAIKMYSEACSIDYNKLKEKLIPLKELMDKTQHVEIVAPETKLNFSTSGTQSVICYGERNLPDGEIYTAPVKDSVNGYIKYNVPSLKNGIVFEDIFLRFKDGKIVESYSSDSRALESILNTDEGSRYIGEFALGVNPKLHSPLGSVLFDEKINGSLHFTPGDSMKRSDNGNRSAIHWDLVQIQTPKYGGGEIRFDDTVVRKDGKFTLSELAPINDDDESGM